MELSPQGIETLKYWEGLRLDWYDDGVGVQTIGYGHAKINGDDFGVPITSDQADQLLADDLVGFNEGVTECVTFPVSQNQFDALVLFAFNLGVHALAGSTLLKLVNNGRFELAAEEFPKWNHAGGHEMPGLTNRRNAEAAIFVSSDYTYGQQTA